MSKLLFFVTEDYYFVSHRLALGIAARDAGYDVCVVTRVRQSGFAIRSAGLRLIPFENARSSLNPFTEFLTLLRLIRVYRRERPDIVHHVAMKPILYGSIAARCAGRPRVINAVAGLGWLFTSDRGVARLLSRAVRAAMKALVNRGIALVQNPDDARILLDVGIQESAIRMIRGSGVDLSRFSAVPPPEGVPAVLFPARLLWDKGVGEFVTAAKILRDMGVMARFLVAGEPDPSNPASVSAAQIEEWTRAGAIEHLGFVEEMPALLVRCHIVCLPSYREGLPKSLLEAAAAARPIVTTNVPGCREVVRHGENGLLVPPRDAAALADALKRLIFDAELRATMGANGRRRAEREFGLEAVVQQTLQLYREAVA